MAQDTLISWTKKTWNPTHGCSRVSEGCRHCYAEALSLRYKHTTLEWTHKNAASNVTLKRAKLAEPLAFEPDIRCFVNSMSDLFHPQIPFEYVAAVFGVMASRPDVTFQTLTKRPERMAEFFRWIEARGGGLLDSPTSVCFAQAREHGVRHRKLVEGQTWPLPNVWLGVSVEDARAVPRIDILRTIPAAVRFVSAEPLLGPLGPLNLDGIHWVIVGGESHGDKTKRRELDQAWAREVRDACLGEGVAFFYKQDSGHTTELRPWLVEADGSRWIWHQWPDDHAAPVRVAA